jgi:hypothetical protein
MKWIIICILSFLLASCSGDDNSSTQNSFFENSKAFDGFLSEADFKELFPHANHGRSSVSFRQACMHSPENPVRMDYLNLFRRIIHDQRKSKSEAHPRKSARPI